MVHIAPGIRRRILPFALRRLPRLAWVALGCLVCIGAGRAAAAPASPHSWQAFQRVFYFHHLDSRDGLVQNSVSFVFQDQTGFIWLGTQGGLFRYDGYALKRFTHDPDRADSLPDSFRVSALADAGDGRLWVGSGTGGLRLFDPAHARVLPLPDAVTRANLAVTGLLRLGDGSLLIGSPRGLDRLHIGPTPHLTSVWAAATASDAGVHALTRCMDGTVYAAAGTAVVELATKDGARVLATTRASINALACDGHGKLLVARSDGLYRLDPVDASSTRLWPRADAASAAVRDVALDHNGHLWLALADRSLLRLDAAGDTLRVHPAPVGIEGGLPDSRINSLFVDRAGLLWVGTFSAGLAWTNPLGSPVQSVLNLDGDPRARGYVRALNPAAGADQYWVTLSGRGLLHYDSRSQTVVSHSAAVERALAGLPGRATDAPVAAGPTADFTIRSILADGHGQLLLASRDGIVRFDPATDTAQRAVLDGHPVTQRTRALLRGKDGDLWVAYADFGLVRYRGGRAVQHYGTANGLAGDSAMAIAEDHQGRIWAGTTEGVSVIDPATGKVLHSFREIPGDTSSLAGRWVTSLLVTRAGQVWVGTSGGLSQLQQLDAHGARFKRYGLSNGLPDITIDCMLEDARGSVWFSTNFGIGTLDPASGTIRNFGRADGLHGDEYNVGACLAARDGQLLFGGQGFDFIDPAAMRPPSRHAPIAITAAYSGSNGLWDPSAGTTVEIATGNRSIYIEYAALDYSAPGRNRYRVRLVGRSLEWSAPTRQAYAAFQSLTPGAYRFEVQAVLRDGSFGNIASLNLRVADAWWWTPAMRVIYAAALALLLLIALLGWRSHHVEQLRHRRQLRLRENRLRHALWGSSDQFWDWNLKRNTILRLGPKLIPGGHDEESMAAERWRRTMVHPEDLAGLDHAMAEHLAGHTSHFEVEHRVRGRDGEWLWVLSRGRIVERDAAGKPLRMCGTERDISALRAADRDRRIASEVIRNMSEAVAVTDLDYRFVSVNTAFTRMTGYAEHEVLGRDVSMLYGSRHGQEIYTQLRQALAEAGHWRGELWKRRKDGEEFLCWVELNEVRDAGGQRTHLISVLTDITERKRAEQELRYLANYDTLTGLPNRALLGERLGAALINARRSGHKVGLLFLDLDRFKHINDSLGHTAGDRTLKAVGARLRQYVRENDVVARLGGDEFTVVLENLADARGAEEMAQRLLQAFVKPLAVTSTQEAVISPSIGIALYPDHGQTPSDLLKCADTAMYSAKERGRNTWAIYHSGLDTRARDHATLITALRRALDRNELFMVYQPKLSLREDTITGMEALVRWRSPTLGDIPPSVFIPLAEESGQIHEISAYVFATACADLGRFRDAGHRELVMAINLSAAQLNRSDLTLNICDMLAEHDVAPNQIELELTETMVMANAEQSLRVLGELKSIGSRLAIDDFGTGYSSLAYLKRLPIDTLKIDQTFVGDITNDPDDAAITSTIITMAHSLGLKVVAEGVETPEQLAFLRAQHCDEIQGYWFSRPLTADACLKFLDQHAATSIDPA